MVPEKYQTKDMYEQGRKEELIALKDDPETLDHFSEWDYMYTGRALYDLKRYEECLELYKIFHGKYPMSSMMDNQMGWSLYHARLKNFDFERGNAREFKRQAEFVIEHSDGSVYSPRWRTTVLLCDAVLEGKFGRDGRETERVDGYLDLVDPDTLSDQCGVTSEGREIASDREKWYILRIKIKNARGLWDECYDWAEKGLQTIRPLHYSNDLWWPNYQAKCRIHQGRPAEARELLLQAINGKNVNGWDIYNTLFKACRDLGEEKDALRYAAEAVTNPSAEPVKMGKLFDQISEYLMTIGKKEEAYLHRQLAISTYRENRRTYQEKENDRDIPADMAGLDFQSTRRRLLPVWNEWKEAGRTYYTGEIKNILPNGRSGFLTADNGEDYYYSIRDFRRKRVNPEQGMKVRFTLEERLDRRKNEMKATAVDITIL